MGRKCCYKSYSCSPCYNSCCPPLFGPCCPPPCNPCFPLCNPCYDGFGCSCDACSTKGKSYFVGSSNNTIDISGLPSPYTITFDEQQDCLCEYVNNSTFIPKCKGYYKFTVSVPINNDISGQTVSVNIVVNGTVKATSQYTYATIGSNTFAICQSICLNKGESVYVTVSPTSGLTLNGVRTFTGSKIDCKSSCCC